MPFFSIIVPAFNKEEYIANCIKSVQDQSFEDWEIIIVDDASSDNTASIVYGFSNEDDRIHLERNEKNIGSHLSRKKGVQKAEGEYILFLDADDHYAKDKLVVLFETIDGSYPDIFHFGMRVIPQKGISTSTAQAFERHANSHVEKLTQSEILMSAFAESEGYRQDWRITQRAFRSDLVKTAFELSCDDRLDVAEDGYEYFICASIAETEMTQNDIVLYEYNLGFGSTNSNQMRVSDFIKSAYEHKKSYFATEQYVKSNPSLIKIVSYEGFKAKLIDAVGNIWHERVVDSEKREAAYALAKIVGDDDTACELLRFARDEIYDCLVNRQISKKIKNVQDWIDIACDLTSDCEQSKRFISLKKTVDSHLESLFDQRNKFEIYNEQDIRIFVSCHKNVELFESSILQPIQVGSANSADTYFHMLGDDQGENISILNPMYCELTAQYWAWKNVNANYYGFCHYRRYFNFSDNQYKENAYGEIIDGHINSDTQIKYGLDDRSIRNVVEDNDIVITEIKDLRKMGGNYQTPLEQYREAPLLYEGDLFTSLSILRENHPDYEQDIELFINGNHSCFCNMYVMKKEIFFDYCEWLFPILEKLCEVKDMSHYSKEALRTPGHLSERLFNIYLNHHDRIGSNWKIKQVQCVHFEYPEKNYPLERMSEEAIPVVFAADDNYAPMVTTTIKSMLDNASDERDYDIFILSNGISERNQSKMRFELCRENVSLRFINAISLVNSYNLSTNNTHIGVETYFRFLIQDVLSMYDKVLYLDSDLIVQGDVSELYSIDLEGNLIGAVRDIDFLGNLNMKDGKRLKYNEETLKMSNPYDYFQAGVLVMNTKAMRESFSVDYWLNLASNKAYIYNDQDILNYVCQGRVVYLDPRWNVMNDCGGRIANVFSVAPAAVYEEYLDARNDPFIIHYAGFEKPWKDWDCDLREIYWKYARKTSFYEDLLKVLLKRGSAYRRDGLLNKENLKRIADPILPVGTQRREVAKKVARRIIR